MSGLCCGGGPEGLAGGGGAVDPLLDAAVLLWPLPTGLHLPEQPAPVWLQRPLPGG